MTHLTAIAASSTVRFWWRGATLAARQPKTQLVDAAER
jgi:hypothetical protein